jgi:hypothetical protein
MSAPHCQACSTCVTLVQVHHMLCNFCSVQMVYAVGMTLVHVGEGRASSSAVLCDSECHVSALSRSVPVPLSEAGSSTGP